MSQCGRGIDEEGQKVLWSDQSEMTTRTLANQMPVAMQKKLATGASQPERIASTNHQQRPQQPNQTIFLEAPGSGTAGGNVAERNYPVSLSVCGWSRSGLRAEGVSYAPGTGHSAEAKK